MNTPLQVTILILIILSGGAPPRQREALFNEYLEVIYKREKAKARWVITTEKEVLFGLHQYLGYLIQSRAEKERGGRDYLTEQEFVNAIRDYLEHFDDTLKGRNLEAQVRRLVDEARERLVLIVEPRPGAFGFELRSLLEFFAAGHLNDTAMDSTQRLERFEAIARQDHWRNVALFFAGRLSRQTRGEAPGVLQVCRDVDAEIPDVHLRRGVQLALDLASDRAFGPHRNLQRDTINFSLDLLDHEPTWYEVMILKNGLTKVPKDDIGDYVVPDLKARFKVLSRSHVGPVIDIYSELAGPDEAILRILDRYLKSTDASDVSWAIAQCFDLDLPADWLAPRVAGGFVQLTEETVTRTIGRMIVEWPALAEQVLFRAGLSEAVLTAALAQAIQRGPGAIRRKEGFAVVQGSAWDHTDTLTQVRLAVALRGLLEVVVEDLELQLRRRYSFSGFMVMPFSHDAQTELANQVEKRIGKVRLLEIAGNRGILAPARAFAWVLAVIANRTDREILENFIDYFHSERDVIPWLAEFFLKWFRVVDNSLAFLVRWDETSGISRGTMLDEVAGLPEIEDQLLEMLRNARSAYQALNRESRERFALELVFSRLNLDEQLSRDTGPCVPEIIGDTLVLLQTSLRYTDRELKRPSDIDIMVRALGGSMPALPNQQVDIAIQRLQDKIAIGQDRSEVFDHLNLLVTSEWECNGALVSKLLNITEKIVEESNGDSSKAFNLELEIAARILLDRQCSTEVILSALEALGRASDDLWPGDLSFAHLEHSDRLLRAIRQFLTGTVPIVRKSAIRLIGLILEKLDDVYGDGEPNLYDHQVLKTTYWGPEIPKELICSADGPTEVGIRLLACSRLSATRDLPWILEAIRVQQSDSEISAWAFFIRTARVPSTKATVDKWCLFLATLLESDECYSRIIRRAALQRYVTLVRSSTRPLMEKESELALPLGE